MVGPLIERELNKWDLDCAANASLMTYNSPPDLYVGLIGEGNQKVKGGGAKTPDNFWDYELEQPSYNSETKSWGRSFTHTISTQLSTARLGGCHEIRSKPTIFTVITSCC